jgi:hypothetical protein
LDNESQGYLELELAIPHEVIAMESNWPEEKLELK